MQNNKQFKANEPKQKSFSEMVREMPSDIVLRNLAFAFDVLFCKAQLLNKASVEDAVSEPAKDKK